MRKVRDRRKLKTDGSSVRERSSHQRYPSRPVTLPVPLEIAVHVELDLEGPPHAGDVEASRSEDGTRDGGEGGDRCGLALLARPLRPEGATEVGV